MPIRRLTAPLALASLLVAGAAPAAAQTAPVALTLAVDASEATRGILHVRETVPVSGAAVTLVYPKWIPGEHAPNGPIENVATLVVRAGERTLTWRRDLVDLYAYHVDVPPGTSALDVRFDYLGANGGQYSSARLATPNLLSLTWNKVVLYPLVANTDAIVVTPALTLPSADWKFGTALETASQNGATVTFKPVSLTHLVDSPLDAGTNVRSWPLGDFDGAPVRLDAFADTPEELAASDATIALFRNLVVQMKGLYGARHFDHYTFLLTLSDVMPGEGVEHHQSSDDGTGGDFLIDRAATLGNADLLPHEFNHSWDGKFRRPADLTTANFQDPMRDDLLWVYEGMTQFYGDLQAERSGLLSKEQWLARLASTWATLDHGTGRQTRPLYDTAAAAPFLYGAPRTWAGARRAVDFYAEGELMWLEADVLIRSRSHGRASLDDVARRFFGRSDTGPVVQTYTRDDVIAAMNAVQPYDWRTFFAQRVDAIAPHPPDFFTPAGYRLVYTAEPTAAQRAAGGRFRGLNATFSAGFFATGDGTVVDVAQDSPAARAGLGPGAKIVALDDRAITGGQGQLDGVLAAHARGGGPIRLLVVTGNVYRTLALDYTGGPKYARLERIPDRPDGLSPIAQPYGARRAPG